MVLFLLVASHDVSLGDSSAALLTEGRSAGQSRKVGVYPLGEFGRARGTFRAAIKASRYASSGEMAYAGEGKRVRTEGGEAGEEEEKEDKEGEGGGLYHWCLPSTGR